jgi:hypothetical protein
MADKILTIQATISFSRSILLMEFISQYFVQSPRTVTFFNKSKSISEHT